MYDGSKKVDDRIMDEISFFRQLQAINRQADFNGAWVIVDRTGVRFQDQSGWANFETKEPFTADTITAIGSLTKQFTAIAILQLFENHQLKLEDHLSRYLPNYTYENKITIEQLLTMTSGVPDYTDLIANSLTQSLKAQHRAPTDIQLKVDQTLGKDIPITEILTLINNSPLTFVPGSQFAYSNTNYALLTQLLKT